MDRLKGCSLHCTNSQKEWKAELRSRFTTQAGSPTGNRASGGKPTCPSRRACTRATRTNHKLPVTARYQDNGNNARDSKCEPRERTGQEILPRAHRRCRDRLEEGGPERNRTRQYRACHEDHQEAASPHVALPEARAAVSAGANRQPHQLSSRRPWAKVRAQFRPLGARDLRTFVPVGKSANKQLICRDLLDQTLLNLVQCKNFENLSHRHDQEELECVRFAPLFVVVVVVEW